MIRRSIMLLAIAACGGPDPRPTATGTFLCEPAISQLLTGAPVSDPEVMAKAEEREAIARFHRPDFLRRVAADTQLDAAVIIHAASIRRVKDSRLVEVGVALPDRVLATRVCDSILAHLRFPHPDVRIVDECAPVDDR
jgi:hypothetical protein